MVTQTVVVRSLETVTLGMGLRVTPFREGILIGTLPPHDLLSQVFKCSPWETLCEDVTQLPHGLNLQKLNPTLVNFFSEPDGFGSIPLATRRPLRRKHLCQNQRTGNILVI